MVPQRVGLGACVHPAGGAGACGEALRDRARQRAGGDGQPALAREPPDDRLDAVGQARELGFPAGEHGAARQHLGGAGEARAREVAQADHALGVGRVGASLLRFAKLLDGCGERRGEAASASAPAALAPIVTTAPQRKAKA
jgi:hypothetical protein